MAEKRCLEQMGSGLLLGEIEMRLIESIYRVNSFSIIWNYFAGSELSDGKRRALLV